MASDEFRASTTPTSHQNSKLQQIEDSIGSRSVGKQDLWADVTDMIQVSGGDNLVHLGNAILKKQQAAREAEEREKAKKLEKKQLKKWKTIRNITTTCLKRFRSTKSITSSLKTIITIPKHM